MADMSLKTVNIKKLQILWGPVEAHGFGDEIVDVEMPDDLVEVVTGADGEVTHNMKPARNAKVTLTLKQSSLVNAVLSGYAIADGLTGAVVFPFTVLDGSGTTLFFAAAARIIKMPNIKYAKSVQDRVWVFGTGPAEYFVGGN